VSCWEFDLEFLRGHGCGEYKLLRR
jgi:hypothetical protein